MNSAVIDTAEPGYGPHRSAGGRSATGRSWLAAGVGVLLLAAAVLAVYGGVIEAPLICDDYTTMAENPSVRKLWPLWNFSGEPSPLRPSPEYARRGASAGELYDRDQLPFRRQCSRPAIGSRIWASISRRRSSVGAGAADAALGILCRALDRAAGLLGWLSALVWAVHPLNTEAVAYITRRTESQMGLFYLATMYAAVRYWTAAGSGSRAIWLVLAAIACQCGALSKEMMASVPAVALLYERTFISGSFWLSLRRSWPLYVALVAGWIPQVVINYHGPRTPSAGFHLGLPAYMWWYTRIRSVAVVPEADVLAVAARAALRDSLQGNVGRGVAMGVASRAVGRGDALSAVAPHSAASWRRRLLPCCRRRCWCRWSARSWPSGGCMSPWQRSYRWWSSELSTSCGA